MKFCIGCLNENTGLVHLEPVSPGYAAKKYPDEFRCFVRALVRALPPVVSELDRVPISVKKKGKKKHVSINAEQISFLYLDPQDFPPNFLGEE